MSQLGEKISVYLIQFGVNLLCAILILVVGKWVSQLIAKLVEKALEKSKFHKTLVSFTKNIVYYVILLFVAIASLNRLGIETNSLVALIGAAGLAVGFALQGSLANFAAGVMIIIFSPFEVGDTIQAQDVSGTVEEIQIFNTILNAGDKRIIIPNSKITSDKLIVFLKK